MIAIKPALGNNIKKRRGRPEDCLLNTLKAEVQWRFGKELGLNNLGGIKDLANDRERLIKVFTEILRIRKILVVVLTIKLHRISAHFVITL